MAFVLYKAGLGDIYDTFSGSNKYLLLLAFSLTFIVVFAKAIRWKFILKKLDYNISVKNASQYFCVGMYGGTFTPGKVGDLLRAHTLRRKEDVPYIKGASSVIMDRLTDLLAVFFLMFCGIILIFLNEEDEIFSDVPVFSVIAAIALIMIGLYLLFNEKVGGKIIKKISNKMVKSFKFLEKRTEKSGHEIVEELYSEFDKIKRDKSFFAMIVLFSMGIWVISLFQAHLILLAFHVHVGFHYVLAFVTLAIVIGLIPITLSGLGTREAAMIYLFGLISVSAADAGSMSLLIYFFGSVIPALYGAIYFFKKQVE